MSPAVSARSSSTAASMASVWSRCDGLALVVVVRLLEQWPVAHLDGVGAPGDLDHRRAAEVRGEAARVDGRGGDHHLEVGPARQQLGEVAEDEVDVEAALVGLVDDQGVVAAQVAVALQLREQDAVGHHLDPALRRGAVGEPHLVADRLAQLGAELLGDPLRHAAGGDPPGLGVPDHAAAGIRRVAASQHQRDLRQLGRLARAGLPRDHHHLVVPDRGSDVVAASRHRQVGGEVDAHSAAIVPGAGHAGPTSRAASARGGRGRRGAGSGPRPDRSAAAARWDRPAAAPGPTDAGRTRRGR